MADSHLPDIIPDIRFVACPEMVCLVASQGSEDYYRGNRYEETRQKALDYTKRNGGSTQTITNNILA